MTLVEFFTKHKNILNIQKIEEDLNLSQGTISKAINGKRKIPNKHVYNIKQYLLSVSEDINEVTI